MLMPRDRLTYRPLGRPTVVQGVFALCGSVDSSGNASFSALPSNHPPSTAPISGSQRGQLLAVELQSSALNPELTGKPADRQSAGTGRLT